MIKKKILVLMSSYNGEKYIKKQIESIMEQRNISDLVLRIRDDGSKDETCNIIRDLQKIYPGKIELIEGKNVGYNASFFELINGAEGYDYYSISDQDDVWLPAKLSVAIKALEENDVNTPLLYASTSYLVYDDLKPYGQTRNKSRKFTIYNTIIQNICPGHTQVFNNALLSLIQGDLDTSRVYVYDSWITNVAMLYGKIVFNKSSYTLYRQHKGNQLGSGTGKIGQLLASAKRTGTGDGLKYRHQIEYFAEKYKNKLSEEGYYKEIAKFISSKSLLSKIKYALTGKMYRQKRIETVAFYAAVILGKY